MEIENEEIEILMEQEPYQHSTGGAVNSVNGQTGDVVLTTSDLENTSDYQTGTEVQTAISTAIAGKQDTLTAGDNITIQNNVISATDTTYTAGDGVNISGGKISVDFKDIGARQSLYIDAVNGSDTNNGTSSSAPFKTLEKALAKANQQGSNFYIYIMSAGTYAWPSNWLFATGKSLAFGLYTGASGTITISMASRVRFNNCFISVDGNSNTPINIATATPGVDAIIEPQSSEVQFSYVNFDGVRLEPKGSTVRIQNSTIYSVSAAGTNTRINNSTVSGDWTGDSAPITLKEGSDGEIGALTAAARSTDLGRPFISAETGTHLSISGALTDNTTAGLSYTYGINVSHSILQESPGYVATYDNMGGGVYIGGGSLMVKDNVVLPYTAFTGTDGNTAGTSGLVPAPATTDAGKFLKADGTWDTAGGGGSPYNVYSTVTTSNSNRGGAIYLGNLNASQEQFADPTTSDTHKRYIHILPYSNTTQPANNSIILGSELTSSSASAGIGLGFNSSVEASGVINIGGQYGRGENSVIIGRSASNTRSGSYVVLLGYSSQTVDGTPNGAVGLGAYSRPSRTGEVNIGSFNTSFGYSNTNYRLISGVHDGQDVHDAATVAQGNTLATSAPTTSTVGVLGQLYTDTTTMHTYQLGAIDNTDPSNPVYTWVQRW